MYHKKRYFLLIFKACENNFYWEIFFLNFLKYLKLFQCVRKCIILYYKIYKHKKKHIEKVLRFLCKTNDHQIESDRNNFGFNLCPAF